MTNLPVLIPNQEAVLATLGLDARAPATMALLLACQKYDLDPILGHAIVLEQRFYVTHAGLLHAAHRSGQLDGIVIVERTESKDDYYCRVEVWRKDCSHPFTGEGWFSRTVRHRAPRLQAQIRAERMALRRAFSISIPIPDEDGFDDHGVSLPSTRPALPPMVAPSGEAGRSGSPGEVETTPAGPPLPADPSWKATEAPEEPSDENSGPVGVKVPPSVGDKAQKRAMDIARLARTAQVDDALLRDLIMHVSAGRTTSKLQVSEGEEFRTLCKTIHGIGQGVVSVSYDPEGKLVVAG